MQTTNTTPTLRIPDAAARRAQQLLGYSTVREPGMGSHAAASHTDLLRFALAVGLTLLELAKAKGVTSQELLVYLNSYQKEESSA